MTERDPNVELERALFDAARREQPDDRVRARTRQLVRSASAGIHAVTVQSERRKRAKQYLPLFGAGLAAAAILLAFLSAQRAPSNEPHLTIAPEVIEPAPKRAAVPAPEVPVIEPAAPVRPAVAQPAPEAPRKVAPVAPKPAPTLAEEIAILDRARGALAANDGAQALALVDAYERELRGTRMRAEAALLRIEALAARGDRARAAQLARAFMKDHAGSPLADRARALSTLDEPPTIEGQPEGELP